jgi:hypothetical protein
MIILGDQRPHSRLFTGSASWTASVRRDDYARQGRRAQAGRLDSFAAADVFLRFNGWRLRRAPMQIYAEMMQIFEPGTFEIAHIDPWIRSFAVALLQAPHDRSL